MDLLTSFRVRSLRSPAKEADDSTRVCAGKGGRTRDRVEGVTADPVGKATTATDPAKKTTIRPKGRRLQLGRLQQRGSGLESRDNDESSCGGDEEGVVDGTVLAVQGPAPDMARRVSTPSMEEA